MPRLIPPGPSTAFSQPGCYLSKTSNCSRGLTGEHYISKSVLEQLDGEIEIGGVPWLASGERKKVGINSLISKVLCQRHNNALSPLDDEAAKFFAAVKRATIELAQRSLSRRNSFNLFSGELIELWMLKVVCGVCLSFASRDGTRVKEDHIFDLDKVVRAFSKGLWDQGAGLHLHAPIGKSVVVPNSISVAPLTAVAEKRVVGARLWLLGHQFDLLFDTTGIVPEGSPKLGVLRFYNERRTHVLYLTWPPDVLYTVAEVLTQRAPLPFAP